MGSQNGGYCCPTGLFKSWQSSAEATPHFQVSIQGESTFFWISSQNARMVVSMGETSCFRACVASPWRWRCFYVPTSNHSLSGFPGYPGKSSNFFEVATNQGQIFMHIMCRLLSYKGRRLDFSNVGKALDVWHLPYVGWIFPYGTWELMYGKVNFVCCQTCKLGCGGCLIYSFWMLHVWIDWTSCLHKWNEI